MHDCRRVLQRLHEVRLERVTEQHSHGARAFELGGRYGLTFLGVANDDALETRAQVLERRRERKNRHHFGRRGDVEAGLARDAVVFSTQTNDDVSQRAVVYVENATPRDVVELVLIALVERIVDDCGE